MNITVTEVTSNVYTNEVSTTPMNQTGTDNTTIEAPFQVGYAAIILSTIDCFLILVITVGNTLTITAVCKYKRLQTPSNVMIVFLSVCDLILGMVYTPTKVLFKTWPNIFNGKISCILTHFISHFSAMTAIFGLSMMSMERAYAVQFPFHYHSHMTLQKAAAASIIAFTVSVILCIPLIILGKWEVIGCSFVNLFPMSYIRTLIVCAMTVLILGFIAFFRVLLAELRRRKKVAASESQQLSWERKSAHQARLMCIIYVSSIMFWSPHILHYFVNTFLPTYITVSGFRILSILDLCSSAVNFLIYGIKNSKFRTAYKQLLGCKVSAGKAAELGISLESTETAEESC